MTDLTTDGAPSAELPTRHLALAIRCLIAGYFILVVGVVWALIAVDNTEDKRAEGDRDILLAYTVGTCEERNNTKNALRETINAGIEGGSVGDLTKIPGFNDLDAATQIFFRNLATLSEDESGKSSTERLRAYRDSLVNEDCTMVGAELREQLEMNNDG